MNHPPSHFGSIDKYQPISRVLELPHMLWRDHNTNNGSGNLTIHNDYRVINQSRRMQWYIQGTDEEEMEYEQYGEYKRSDIRLLKMIDRKRFTMTYDSMTGEWIPTDCEQSIFLAEIVSGNEKGTIVTVECFQGPNAPERWKHSFRLYSEDVRATKAHLLALNRSKIPLLIMMGELVPAAIFARKTSLLAHLYLTNLTVCWHCGGGELWMDCARGIICRGPEGPDPDINVDADGFQIFGEDTHDPAVTIDLLKDDILLRYLASFKSKTVDEEFVSGLQMYWDQEEVPAWAGWPTVIRSSTNTPIAVVDRAWRSPENSLVERWILANGWSRFRLNGRAGRYLWLIWVSRAFSSWLPQAWRVFQTRGISLQDDLSDYKLVLPRFYLKSYLSDSEVDRERRLAQPIFLFVRPPPLCSTEETFTLSSPCRKDTTSKHVHYWSFQKSGQSSLSPEECHYFGLPVEFTISDHSVARSWSNHIYELVRKYQVLRGFDPATADFVRHLKLDVLDPIFRPIDDSNQLRVLGGSSSSSRPPLRTMCAFFPSERSSGSDNTSMSESESDGHGEQTSEHSEARVGLGSSADCDSSLDTSMTLEHSQHDDFVTSMSSSDAKIKRKLETSDHILRIRQRTGQGDGEIEVSGISHTSLNHRQQEGLDITGRWVRNVLAAQAALEKDAPATAKTTREVLESEEVLKLNALATKNMDIHYMAPSCTFKSSPPGFIPPSTFAPPHSRLPFSSSQQSLISLYLGVNPKGILTSVLAAPVRPYWHRLLISPMANVSISSISSIESGIGSLVKRPANLTTERTIYAGVLIEPNTLPSRMRLGSAALSGGSSPSLLWLEDVD